MNLVVQNSFDNRVGGPRVCGDEPVFALDPERTELWTPRMRG